MKKFDLTEFRDRFSATMADVRKNIAELDTVTGELHRQVSAFTGRAR